MKKNEIEYIDKILALTKVENGRKEIYDNLAYLALDLNEKDLARVLKELLKYPDGVDVLKEKWKILLNNSQNSLDILRVYKENPEISKLVLSDIQFLINYTDIFDSGLIARELIDLENGEEAIAENFDVLLEDCASNFDSLYIPLLKDEKHRKIAKEKFEILKQNATAPEFFNFIRKIENLPEFEEEFNKYSFLEKLYSSIKVEKTAIPSIEEIYQMDMGEVSKALKMQDIPRIIDIEFKGLVNSKDMEEKRLILEEVSNGNDFEFLDVGSSSLVLKTGKQVVKLGAGRMNYEVPYHPRLMMPYFRKQYDDNTILEVYNLGLTVPALISDQELLSIYKELEAAGILWSDAKKDNLLVLREDNDLPDFIKKSPNFNVFGFLDDDNFPTEKHVPLKKGDIVICDLDYLYVKGDPNYSVGIPDDIILDYISRQKKEKGVDR